MTPSANEEAGLIILSQSVFLQHIVGLPPPHLVAILRAEARLRGIHISNMVSSAPSFLRILRQLGLAEPRTVVGV